MFGLRIVRSFIQKSYIIRAAAQQRIFDTNGYQKAAVHPNNRRWTSNTLSMTSQQQDQGSREAANYQARVDLAAAYRILAHFKMSEGVSNHLSVRAPSRVQDKDVMLIIPHGLHWREVTASCLLGIDFFTDDVIEGDGKPHQSAVSLHRPIHIARFPLDGTTAILHTHQTFATTVASLDTPEPFKIDLTQGSMRFLDRIAYDEAYGGFARPAEEGERLAKVLSDKDVLMMGQHGVTVVGKRICDAFDDLYYLERSAEVQVHMMSTGSKMMSAPHHVIEKVAKGYCYKENAFLHFESMKRLLMTEGSKFTD